MHQLRRWLGRARPSRWFTALGAALVTMAAVDARAQQQPAATGTITGRVTDAITKAPVPNVQIRVVTSGRGTLTADDGSYRLANIPVGTVTIQALRVGYAPSGQRPVAVIDAGTTTADFALSIAANILDQVVVQASGEQQRVREAGNLPSQISGDSIPKAAVNDFSDALSGRAPGVEIQQYSGTTGGGSDIRIRGANSASLSNTPLLVIDGVRADNNVAAGQASTLTGGQGPSRFDDLDPNDIENIEIVKGPAGSALYGSAGANGVIYITTKHGHAGKTRWAAHGDYGSVRNQTSYPGNYNIVGNFGGTVGNGCTLDLQSQGVCTAAGPVTAFSPIAALSPFVNGYRSSFGGSVSGGTDATQYFLSGDYYREQGVYANNVDRRANAHANITAHLSNSVDVTVTGGYLQGRLSLPQNDNSLFGVIGLAILGGVKDNATHGYFEGITPDIIAQYRTSQLVDRYTTGATGTWRATNWLVFTGQGGVDFSNQTDHQILPFNLIVNNGPQSASGQVQEIPQLNWTYTTNLTGTASYNLFPNLSAKSSLGTQYIVNSSHLLTSSGRGLVGPVTSVGGATGSFLTVESTPADQPTLAFFGQEELSYKDRIFVSGALRHESIKILGGAPLQSVTYPSVNVSWVIGEEPFFPRGSFLSSLRLRGALGQAGQLPFFRQASTSFAGGATRFQNTDIPAALLNNLGQALKPERTTEYEGGFDAGFLSDRISLTGTYYNKTTHDALISVTLPGSVGSLPNGAAPTHFANIGATSNKGVEVGLTGTIVQGRDFNFDLTLNGSYNVNRLITLGNAGVDTIRFNNGAASQIQRFAPGFPLGGYWSFPYTYTTTNGVVTSANLNVSSKIAYLGPVLPPTAVSVRPAFTVLRYVRLSALFDHKDGNNIFNNTEEFRCGFGLCRGLYDKTAPAAQQAGDLVAAARRSDKFFINNAEFWKLREVSVSLSAPQSLANRMRMSDLRFTLSGRNLHTWTPYTGYDPESNFAAAAFLNTEFTTQPPVRYWTGRFDVTF